MRYAIVYVSTASQELEKKEIQEIIKANQRLE